MIKPGPKTKQWNKTKSQIKKDFFNWDLTYCELGLKGCWRNNALGFAHTRKRRNIEGDEIYQVVLACNPCHDIVESWGEEKMNRFLVKIIRTRNHMKKLMGYNISKKYII